MAPRRRCPPTEPGLLRSADRPMRSTYRKTQSARDGQMRSGGLYCEENHNGNSRHLTRHDLQSTVRTPGSPAGPYLWSNAGLRKPPANRWMSPCCIGWAHLPAIPVTTAYESYMNPIIIIRSNHAGRF